MKILPGDLAAVMENDPAINSEDEAIKYHMGLHVVAMYREAHELWLQGRTEEAMKINYEAHSLTGADVHPGATIGKGLYIVHPTSICMTKVRIGENFTIMQNCTLGAKLLGECDFSETPCVGNNVTMYANSIVIGNVKVADGVTIGCNSLVLKDADVPNGVYVGCPAYIIKKMEN